MRIFLDANILVSLLNKEYPYFTFTSRIISLAGKPGYNLYTSPVCLAIAFYFAEKKFRSAKAKEKIRILCEHFQIATTTKECVLQTLRNTAITDLEDGLEYYSAIGCKCDYIITENTGDFHFSKIEVLESGYFFKKYLH